jgi:nicotinate-nucleotide adenylyltransferase
LTDSIDLDASCAALEPVCHFFEAAQMPFRDRMQGANRRHSTSYGEDLQRRRLPEKASALRVGAKSGDLTPHPLVCAGAHAARVDRQIIPIATQRDPEQMANRLLARIGIFGGAFDPPHHAHVALARAAIDAWQLTTLHVLPTGDAWHKSHALMPARDRLAMTELAFGHLPRVVIDDRELHRAGPTYTIDTLRELAAQHPGARLVLQIGADQAVFFHRWRQAQELARMACISIAVRVSNQAGPVPFDPGDPLPGVTCDPARVRVLALPAMPHSATEIRQRVAQGLPIGHLVPPAVARYIAEHHLYQTDP